MMAEAFKSNFTVGVMDKTPLSFEWPRKETSQSVVLHKLSCACTRERKDVFKDSVPRNIPLKFHSKGAPEPATSM